MLPSRPSPPPPFDPLFLPSPDNSYTCELIDGWPPIEQHHLVHIPERSLSEFSNGKDEKIEDHPQLSLQIENLCLELSRQEQQLIPLAVHNYKDVNIFESFTSKVGAKSPRALEA